MITPSEVRKASPLANASLNQVKSTRPPVYQSDPEDTEVVIQAKAYGMKLWSLDSKSLLPLRRGKEGEREGVMISRKWKGEEFLKEE